MVASVIMRTFVGLITMITIVGLTYVYAFPPESIRVSRDGAPFFTPPVINPETGKPVQVDVLIRHYKGQ
ncbi:MAG: hypothetical protein OQJ99_01535 [Rhodospirillales bacterium]|nr:hypothetical protein [Rhodospirillales bacterium]MCW8861678.1 hypothetical protein [Rhodospirillales bacterium]MCW8951519.1 hypothetical protein [Rhodospirillales bacterium]MCW9003049.1 hypothetical protein [Rhodospirillales bacterium]MCW9039628.1 hypothetical protein [Rhodospirillales bacterium]